MSKCCETKAGGVTTALANIVTHSRGSVERNRQTLCGGLELARAMRKTANTNHTGRLRNASVRQNDDEICGDDCAAVLRSDRLGFWIFWRFLYCCGDSAFTSRRAEYALMVIALQHDVAVVLSYLSASDGSASYHLDRWKANGAADSTFVETR